MNIEDVAKICHEANKAYCESIGDYSQVDWLNAPQNIKDSAIMGVKFRLTGKHTPEEQHNAWVEFKIDDGWKYGPVKDALKKEHPCIITYSDLPEKEKIKDHLFIGIIDSLKKFIV